MDIWKKSIKNKIYTKDFRFLVIYIHNRKT